MIAHLLRSFSRLAPSIYVRCVEQRDHEFLCQLNRREQYDNTDELMYDSVCRYFVPLPSIADFPSSENFHALFDEVLP